MKYKQFKSTIIVALLLVAGQEFTWAQDTIPKYVPNLVKVHVLPNNHGHKNPYDGDGCKVKFPDGRVIKARFANIDAPEVKNLSFYAGCDTAQPFAYKSRDLLAALISDKDILIDTLPFGKVKWSYDRMVVDPYLLDSSLITFELLRAGTCWFVPVAQKRANPQIANALSMAFNTAKAGKKGLWGLKGRKYSPSYWKRIYRNKPKQ